MFTFDIVLYIYFCTINIELMAKLFAKSLWQTAKHSAVLVCIYENTNYSLKLFEVQ